jgi:hypothetical protein
LILGSESDIEEVADAVALEAIKTFATSQGQGGMEKVEICCKYAVDAYELKIRRHTWSKALSYELVRFAT